MSKVFLFFGKGKFFLKKIKITNKTSSTNVYKVKTISHGR